MHDYPIDHALRVGEHYLTEIIDPFANFPSALVCLTPPLAVLESIQQEAESRIKLAAKDRSNSFPQAAGLP